MNTFQCGRGLLALAALLLSLSFPARADFLYTISYDARTIDGRAYAADSFSFTVGSIINTNGTVPVPGGELYGFTFEELSTWYPNSPGRTFESGPDFTRPIGEVVALFLVTDANPDAVGTYGLIRAGLGIRDSFGAFYNYDGSGALTIAEVPTGEVPEPGSWVLLLSVAGSLFVGGRAHRRDARRKT